MEAGPEGDTYRPIYITPSVFSVGTCQNWWASGRYNATHTRTADAAWLRLDTRRRLCRAHSLRFALPSVLARQAAPQHRNGCHWNPGPARFIGSWKGEWDTGQRVWRARTPWGASDVSRGRVSVLLSMESSLPPAGPTRQKQSRAQPQTLIACARAHTRERHPCLPTRDLRAPVCLSVRTGRTTAQVIDAAHARRMLGFPFASTRH